MGVINRIKDMLLDTEKSEEIRFLTSTIKEYDDDFDAIPSNMQMEFRSGGGYLKIDIEKFEQDKIKLCEYMRRHYPGYEDHLDFRPVNQFSFIGRLLDGGYNIETQLGSKLWHRFMCVDTKGRRWGQPYFAQQEDKGVDECWNKYIRDHKLEQLLKTNK